ncbi:TPA: hypothetical protein ACH3X3_003627 [Trebouxia sp. C0006]
MRLRQTLSHNFGLVLLLFSVVDIGSVSASWGGDWGKSQESQLAFEDFHSKNRSNRSEAFKYTKDDLLIAIPGQTERLSLVEASRPWRRGVNTFVALEKPLTEDSAPEGFLSKTAEHKEHFGTYQDPRSKNEWEKAGDLRASIAPFLAAKEMGLDSFKWVLYGDDDTVFFVDGALDMLENLDYNMPYLLSDDVWFVEDDAQGKQINTHPNRRAPRCLPCGYHDEIADTGYIPWGSFKAPEGCPCTYETICKAPGNEGYFGQNCEWLKVHPGLWYFIHGGAGAIMSLGLFRLISWDRVDGYFMRGSFASGDSMLTVAIYEMTGILPTDPGYGYYRDHVQMFDPGWKGYQTKGPEDWNFDVFDKGNDPEGVLQRLQTAVHGGDCDSECDDQLQHLVSVHIRSRYSQEYAVNANDTDFRHVGPEHHRPASYMHFALDKWYMKFRKARGLAAY